MNTRPFVVTLVAVMLSAAAVYGLSANASGPSEVLPQDRHNPERQPCLNQYSGSPLDLQGCQEECRIDYGVLPYGWGYGPGGSGLGNLYARCIQKCNDDYWKAWDEKMKNLGE